MSETSTNSESKIENGLAVEEGLTEEMDRTALRRKRVARLRLLWDQRKFLVRITVLGLAATTVIASLIPKRYEAFTQLMPPDAQSTSGGVAMLAALTAKAGNGFGGYVGDLLGMKNSGALFIGILRSDTVEDQLIDRFNLKKVYGARLYVDARRALSDRTAISEDRKSGIITLTVTDRDPKRAAGLAAAYVEELDRLVAELSTSAAHRERVFLEDRLTAVKRDLDDAAEKFGQFASKNTAIDIKEQGRAMVEAAAALQGQLIAAEAQLEGLKQIYTENNVRVRSVQARIAELRRQLQKLGGAGSESEPGKVAGTQSDTFYPSIRKLPLLGVTYADLYRRTKIQEAVYEMLTQQYELAKVQEAKETPSVKVLDPVRVPERKSFPPRLLIMLLGTSLALASGTAWVLGNARWGEIDPQDPGKVFALEVFHTVRTQVGWGTQNGSGLRALPRKVWRVLRPASGPKENGQAGGDGSGAGREPHAES